MIENRNGTAGSNDNTPQHSIAQPGFGILSKVPAHATDACCPLRPAGRTAQVLSARKTYRNKSPMGELSSAVGAVPRLSTRLTLRDRWGGLKVRLGLKRNQYAVDPGLYAVGQPDRMAPVLVSATFGIAGAIFTEAALSFLGFGVAPPST